MYLSQTKVSSRLMDKNTPLLKLTPKKSLVFQEKKMNFCCKKLIYFARNSKEETKETEFKYNYSCVYI